MIEIKKRIFNDNPDTRIVTIYICYMLNDEFFSNVLIGRFEYEKTWEDEDCEKIIENYIKENYANKE
jgi:hypothetical protein